MSGCDNYVGSLLTADLNINNSTQVKAVLYERVPADKFRTTIETDLRMMLRSVNGYSIEPAPIPLSLDSVRSGLLATKLIYFDDNRALPYEFYEIENQYLVKTGSGWALVIRSALVDKYEQALETDALNPALRTDLDIFIDSINTGLTRHSTVSVDQLNKYLLLPNAVSQMLPKTGQIANPLYQCEVAYQRTQFLLAGITTVDNKIRVRGQIYCPDAAAIELVYDQTDLVWRMSELHPRW